MNINEKVIETEERTDSLEEEVTELTKAVSQINHFTELVESWNLPVWMIKVEKHMTKQETNYFWIKVLLAGAVITGALTGAAQVINALNTVLP